MKNITKKLPHNGTLKKSKRKTEKEEPGIVEELHNLFVDELQNIYWAEKALTKELPKMIRNAGGNMLAEVLTGHLVVSKEHITRVEEIFYSIGEKAETKKCKTISGLIKDAKAIMKQTKRGMIRDAGIIAAAKKIEHYEIATYGTLCSLAKTLGEAHAITLLQNILNQEIMADEKLSEIASFFTKAEAAGANDNSVSIISVAVLKQTQLV